MTSPSSGLTEIIAVASHDTFMQRCLQLAVLGSGYTAPNPIVGAVLVHEGKIIGEGYHEKHGGSHAEVNCIQSVQPADRSLIATSTLYVSLEPCCHHGKTPPCTDLIISEKIPRVVIGCRDPFPAVNGKGIEKLLAAGVELEYPVLEERCKYINRRFFTFHQEKRPYIILKWAQSANRKMSGGKGEKISISNGFSNRLVHKWRSAEAGIMIGTKTALNDNPELTVRLWKGKNPERIVVDRRLQLPDSLKVFDGSVPTIILNEVKDHRSGNLLFKKIVGDGSGVSNILLALHSLHVLSVLVEGGPKLLQSFIDSGIWDEIRIITNQQMEIPDGISSPEFKSGKLMGAETHGTDTISYYLNPNFSLTTSSFDPPR
jgi:diaminohydroxyphosphoribosylaminopyrimidine deaminase/5-amino-6-(5-phosphoribosylamino)uracil reductase